MSDTLLPAGWDEAKLRRVLAHYEEQTEEDAMLEDETSMEARRPSWPYRTSLWRKCAN